MYSVIDIPELPGMGSPIQRSSGQCLFSGSPKLIAANHVFHRHPTPRHPPSALNSLAINIWPLCRSYKITGALKLKDPVFSFQRAAGNCPLSQKPKAENRNFRLPVLSFELLRYPLVLLTNLEVVEVNGIEPMTSCVQSRCSPN